MKIASILLCFRDKHVFAFYAEIQDGHQKWPGKTFLVKVVSRLATYPACQKFHRNCSISLRFRDKQVFAFNAEIQDGHQKWPGKTFLVKVVSRLANYPACQKFRRNCSISLRFRDKQVFVFNAEIQDGPKSGGKTIFVKSRQ